MRVTKEKRLPMLRISQLTPYERMDLTPEDEILIDDMVMVLRHIYELHKKHKRTAFTHIKDALQRIDERFLRHIQYNG